MTKFTIVDSLPGQGKTTWAIQEMKRGRGPWLYIAPYLDEVKRVVAACPKQAFVQPEQSTSSTKSDHLFQLMADGRNIASTHELFKRIDQDTIEVIHLMGYNLIIDEALEVLQTLPILSSDTRLLFNEKVLSLPDGEGGNTVHKVYPGVKESLDSLLVKSFGPISYIRKWAASERLVLVRGTQFVWVLPAEILQAFKSIYNLTFMFKGSHAEAFYTLGGFNYEIKAVEPASGGRYRLIDHNPVAELNQRTKLVELINIAQGRINQVGDASNSLSHGWWNKHKQTREALVRKRLSTFFRHHKADGTNASHNIWSSFKSNRAGLFGNGFAKSAWVPCNLRATNNYRSKVNLAFVVNRYINPFIKAFFESQGVELCQNQYALSSLLQWLFRSAIRDGKPVSLFLPSSRMRSLLTAWLSGAE